MPLFGSSGQGLSPHPHADVVRKAVIGHADPQASKTSGAVLAPTPPPGPPPGWNGVSPKDERGSGRSPRSPDVENVRPSARSPPNGVDSRRVDEGEDGDDDEEDERPLFHTTPGASQYAKDSGFTPNSIFGGASDAGHEPSVYEGADPLSAAGAYRTSGAESGATSASSSPGLYDPRARESGEDGDDDENGGAAGGNGENDVAAEALAEDSMDDDDNHNEEDAAQAEPGDKFASPFKKSTAEQEYEEMLLSPAQRNRMANKRRRKVFVAVRVRPFLPHETPQEVEPCAEEGISNRSTGEDGEKRGVLAVRGKTLLLVNPAVFPGASGELVADMVRCGCVSERLWLSTRY